MIKTGDILVPNYSAEGLKHINTQVYVVLNDLIISESLLLTGVKHKRVLFTNKSKVYVTQAAFNTNSIKYYFHLVNSDE